MQNQQTTIKLNKRHIGPIWLKPTTQIMQLCKKINEVECDPKILDNFFKYKSKLACYFF
jgi:hypothetical protein